MDSLEAEVKAIGQFGVLATFWNEKARINRDSLLASIGHPLINAYQCSSSS
jgi:hypothetical protein